jgi:hypothetical protein
LARTKPGSDEGLDPEVLGPEGETCTQCGTKLAVDQRYCLNCGTPRAQPRLDYEQALSPGAAGSSANPAQDQRAAQWTPLAAVVAIAILGGMLLLGVLIGQDDNSVTVTEVQQREPAGSATTDTSATTTPTTTSETTTTPPETTTEALPPDGRTPEDAGGGVKAAP